jgi:hypothetical protein
MYGRRYGYGDQQSLGDGFRFGIQLLGIGVARYLHDARHGEQPGLHVRE